MAKLTKIEGVGEFYAQKLREAGIGTTQALLEEGASPQGRQEIAEKTGISETLILEWVNHVDLFRSKGVATQYSELLEAAGVDTVPELAQRNADNLHQAMVNTNSDKHLVRHLPSRNAVEDWIRQAKDLPRVITY